MEMGFFSCSAIVACTAVAVILIPKYLEKNLPMKGEGFAHPGWRTVADVFRGLLDSGELRGGGIAVYYEGEQVVEFVGGYADYDVEVAWSKDTLAMMYSSTKAVAATVMALLVQRGLLDYSKAVSEYWPEFGQNGKEKISVEQLLSHQAGLAVIDTPFSAYDLLNEPDKLGKTLAAQKPNWKPGEGCGYHGYTLGLYQDQLVRRVDPLHRSLSQFFKEEIAEVFGLDMFIGLPLEENYRSTRIYPFNFDPWQLIAGRKYWPSVMAYLTDPKSLISRVIANPPQLHEDGLVNNPYFKEVPSPSTAGASTLASAAKLMGILANGGHAREEDKDLLNDDLIKKLSQPLTSGWDKVLLMNMTYGSGVSMLTNPQGGMIFGAPGAGGQIMYADPQNKLGWAFFTNYHSIYAINDDPRYLPLQHAIYECLDKLKKSS